MASSPLPAGDQASTQYSRLLKLRWLLMAVFVAVILLSLVADFMLGPSGLSWSELMRTLFSPDQAEPTTSVIVWDVRLPYAVMAVVVGLGLGLGRDLPGGRFGLAMDAGRTAAQSGQTGWIELVLHGKPLLLGIQCLRGPRQGPRGASDGQQRDHSSPRAALTWPSVSASWLTGAATALRPASSRAPALKPFLSRYGSSALPNWA